MPFIGYNQIFSLSKIVKNNRGGETVGAGMVMHPPLFLILVFLLYPALPTFQCIDPPFHTRGAALEKQT